MIMKNRSKLITLAGLLIYFMISVAAKGQAIHPQLQPWERNPLDHTKAVRNQVRAIYTSQIGVREKQSNSGAEVAKYLRYVNLPKGNPWCAAFVCWAYGEAGVDNPRSGWSPDLFPATKVVWERTESGFARRSFSEGGKAESGVAEIRCACPPLAVMVLT